MDIGPNIYNSIVFDLHQKVKEFLDALDQQGQIDRDETNTPHIISVDFPGPSVHRCIFSRNGKPENFLMHTRRRQDPIRSWNDQDGYVRKERPKEEESDKRKERDRRPPHVYEHIMEQILPRR